uniref:NADH-ubiquinone oxidoreductase chain 4 n=1 Tax=Spirobrachia sp. YL-2014 TaxID=1535021 RepID=A0A0E3DR12_9ANNE|nr:NADH dehydrogenase subunit 4 [Spirobrachia sp. YL-2014]
MLKLSMLIISLFYFIFILPKYYSWFFTMNFLFSSTPIFILSMMIPSNDLISFNQYFSINSSSMLLILLSLWISSLMIMSSSSILMLKSNSLFISISILMFLILFLSFSTNNLFIFFIFFESSLIPIFSMIMIWGYQPERLQASLYLIIYTISASLPLLLMIFFIYKFNMHLNMFMYNWIFPKSYFSNFFWVMMLIAFLVKLPMFMFHLWLPKAHVEAPVAGSMILAGVLLKLGSYGVLRLSELFQFMNKFISIILIPVCLIGSTIINIICLRQTDLKALIAYSSVSHMAILLGGTLTSSSWGWMGMIILMIAHGLTSSALFYMINILYLSFNTRSIFLMKGMLIMFPMFSFWWLIMNMFNMSIPPSINFLSEIMIFSSLIPISSFLLIFMSTTMFFSAAYSFYIYSSSQHGNFLSYLNNINSIPSISFISIMLHFFPLLFLMFKMSCFF